MNKELKELYNYLNKSELKKEALNISKFIKTAGLTTKTADELDNKLAELIKNQIFKKAFPKELRAVFGIDDDPINILTKIQDNTFGDGDEKKELRGSDMSGFLSRKPFGKSSLQVESILVGKAKNDINDSKWEIHLGGTPNFSDSHDSKEINVTGSLENGTVTIAEYSLNMQIIIDWNYEYYPDIWYILKDLEIKVDDAAWAKAKAGGGGGGSPSTPTVATTTPLSYQQLIVELNSGHTDLKVGKKDGETITVKGKDREIQFIGSFKSKMLEVLDFLEKHYKKEEASDNYVFQKAKVNELNPEYTLSDKGVFMFIVDKFEEIKMLNKLADTGPLDRFFQKNHYSNANNGYLTGAMALFLSETLVSKTKKTPSKKPKKPASKKKSKPDDAVNPYDGIVF